MWNSCSYWLFSWLRFFSSKYPRKGNRTVTWIVDVAYVRVTKLSFPPLPVLTLG